jgi:hypothetical protein
MLSQTLDTAGILLTTAGALLLFAYGLPFKVRTGGQSFRVLTGIDEGALASEKRADRIGWLAAVMLVVGALIQIVAIWLGACPA